MITVLALCIVVSVIAGIFLRSAIHALLLVAAVLGVFVLSCYAFGLNPRVFLNDGIHAAKHEYRVHKREVLHAL